MHTLFSVIHRRVNVLAGLAAVLVIIVVAAPITALGEEQYPATKTGCVTHAMDSYQAMNAEDKKNRERNLEISAKMYGECEIVYGRDEEIDITSYCINKYAINDYTCKKLLGAYIQEMQRSKYWEKSHPALLEAAEEKAAAIAKEKADEEAKYMASILNASNSTPLLQKCDRKDVCTTGQALILPTLNRKDGTVVNEIKTQQVVDKRDAGGGITFVNEGAGSTHSKFNNKNRYCYANGMPQRMPNVVGLSAAGHLMQKAYENLEDRVVDIVSGVYRVGEKGREREYVESRKISTLRKNYSIFMDPDNFDFEKIKAALLEVLSEAQSNQLGTCGIGCNQLTLCEIRPAILKVVRRYEKGIADTSFSDMLLEHFKKTDADAATSNRQRIQDNADYIKEKIAKQEVAAEDEAAAKQAAIDDAFSVFDITAKEAAAKIKAAKEKAVAQETKEDSSYILTNKALMEMVGPLLKKYPQLADIKNIKIKKLTNVTQYKTITKDGIVKTIRCNPCSWHSATLQGLRTGMDLGMPLDIFDAIYNAINDEFGGERPINKSDMRKLIISIWKNLENVMAKAMADPNFNIANAMTKEQIQQIKTQQRKTQANSNDNSGGSTAAGGVAADGAAEGHHEEDHHHHEEEDPGVAPGDPGDHYSSGIGG